MDSVMDSNKLTEENLDIFTGLEVGMKKLHLLVPQGWLAKCAAHIGIKLLMLQHYKTIVVHSLWPPGCREEFDAAGGFENWDSVNFLTQRRHDLHHMVT
jgi:hypothetical protein